MQSDIVFSACAPPACRCPQVTYTPETNPYVVINDDFGGSISMTVEEFDILAEMWIERRRK